MADTFTLEPIGHVSSDYPDKFGIPRQPGLAPSARAVLYLEPSYDDPLAVEGLDTFSHLWLTFVFDRSPTSWSSRVRPPRLGGNQRIGVFASRATHRPNRLGLSLVELLEVELDPAPRASRRPIAGSALGDRRRRVKLHLRGHDLCDATPILDIRPYLPWAESVPDASAGFAPAPPMLKAVVFTAEAGRALRAHPEGESLRRLIEEVLGQDPRPAYHGRARQSGPPEEPRRYGVHLRDVNVRFCVLSQAGEEIISVEAIEPR
ncbi:tRNA (N6-threonylcarbamoyladenosine(37)-N6)-methyltransferase TrmO [Salinicola rhizosphaerae]|uniref:tRNA (N6-threonylcarbamoyladenosine(37)-N6)-methyltransferase TrmO n=1 Tax=Salinicola rhizosphaerae TaxID=1443141 RepID=A0ABQ3DX20_9GAMM|nr:tRNA (N6-threonylcarbamoyladenosine(37)-N6)-methyltransferase TrmO [Salinicola rhizosphaerae]GHB17916.1 tRNA (N6-threonylcarbamoyladenosine(37)-N6)-methyltransferase TrmO [Salinicola rhizosphaerae]